ncbi:DUF4112 domain-containing protein [Capnocytophaga sp. ARDL2]|uniref:DUF4112 domain-containing protein n=1 Tax=Capnocytophaga sp. ARDL2 TaxID=3238809 RepID=UPI00355731B8
MTNHNIYTNNNQLDKNEIKILYTIKKYMDDYYIDGILSFFPVVGDVIAQIFTLFYLYISIFKLKSIRLSVLIIYNALFDICVGLIPYLGIVLDFLNKSYKENYELIIGYAQRDKAIMRKINKRFTFALLSIFLLLTAIVLLIKWTIELSMYIFNWIF